MAQLFGSAEQIAVVFPNGVLGVSNRLFSLIDKKQALRLSPQAVKECLQQAHL
jgi:hypothetical protein